MLTTGEVLQAMTTDSHSAARDGGRQVLSFAVGNEAYGVDILRVQEIRGWSPVTRIPQAPAEVLGVLNLRGVVLPIIDLRLVFGGANADFTPLTVIIVLSVQVAGQRRDCGLVVDSVSDVVELQSDAIRPPPEIRRSAVIECIDGIATADDRMLMLLNIDDLLGKGLLSGAAIDFSASPIDGGAAAAQVADIQLAR
jgi:purine-binding chemotaxis protein CheW